MDEQVGELLVLLSVRAGKLAEGRVALCFGLCKVLRGGDEGGVVGGRVDSGGDRVGISSAVSSLVQLILELILGGESSFELLFCPYLPVWHNNLDGPRRKET